MDERTIRPHAGFEAFRLLLDGVIGEIAAIGRPRRVLPLAAE
jgi:N-formylglutamate deformylase